MIIAILVLTVLSLVLDHRNRKQSDREMKMLSNRIYLLENKRGK